MSLLFDWKGILLDAFTNADLTKAAFKFQGY
jgi:hypothetical protein